MQTDIERAGKRLERSRRALAVDADALRALINTGLVLSCGEGLQPLSREGVPPGAWLLPEEALGRGWMRTLDLLRPVRARDESFAEWRRHPARAVTFEAVEVFGGELEHLHLSHPLVKRLLDRFLSQGYRANDLSRVCAVTVPGESVARVVAYARLTLFGPGATRLHDELIVLAAPWSAGEANVTPYEDSASAVLAIEVTEAALAAGGNVPSPAIEEQMLAASSVVFAQLWSQLEDEADRRASEVRRDLLRRAGKESEDIRALLSRQQRAISAARGNLAQLGLDFGEGAAKDQRRQLELDGQHMERRLQRIDEELESEPAAIEALYAVRMQRVVPVALVFSWPELMA